MIYRKWSLLTGPAVMCGGVAAAAIAINLIFKQDSFAKPGEKQGSASSSK